MKIVIIKQGALGDIIMATPIIRQIQKHHDNDDIWLLTTPPYEHLFDNWQELSIKAFPRKGTINSWRTILWLRKQKFDRLYDLQSNDRTRWLSICSGIPARVGNHPHFPYTIHPLESYAGQFHVFDRLNQILASAQIEPAQAQPVLPVTQNAKAHVNNWLKENELEDKNLVILHAGSSIKHPAKRWPYFAELAQSLDTEGFEIIWVGSEDDVQLNQVLSEKTGIDATGIFTVPQLVELGHHACFAVTNDSAPMHILSCSGIPVFSLFGPTDWRRNHALGQKDRVITLDHATERKLCEPDLMKLENIPPTLVLEKLEQEHLI